MISVGILDYGCGNVGSVAQAFDYLGFTPRLIRGDTKEAQNITHMVLPGVGTFEFAMTEIRKRQLDRVIARHIKSEQPFLGICVGMQVLMREGREFGTHAGLGIIDGHTEKLDVIAPHAPCPHIGWEPVTFSPESRFERMNAERPYFYFNHSYVCQPVDQTVITAQTEDASWPVVMERGNIIGIQCHPEKSHTAGLELLRRFLKTGVCV